MPICHERIYSVEAYVQHVAFTATFNKLLISQPQLKSNVLYGFVVCGKGKAIYRSVEYQLHSLSSHDAILNLSIDQSTNFISRTRHTRNK